MNKTELIERIIDTFTGMGSEGPENVAACDAITLKEAETYLNERRAIERTDLARSEWLPAEVTPELYMEAENCYIRRCQYEVTLDRLVEFLKLGEKLDVYLEYQGVYKSPTDKVVYPTDWLCENMEFPFTPYDLSMIELIKLGQNSPDFDPTDDFCWYEEDRRQLNSTCYPFEEGLIDVKAFASWLLERPERIEHVKDYCMINTDIDYIFRYWRY